MALFQLISVELTKLFPISPIAKVAVGSIMALARNLRKSDSDLLIEEDLAEIFGRGRIDQDIQARFGNEISTEVPVMMPRLYHGSQIESLTSTSTKLPEEHRAAAPMRPDLRRLTRLAVPIASTAGVDTDVPVFAQAPLTEQHHDAAHRGVTMEEVPWCPMVTVYVWKPSNGSDVPAGLLVGRGCEPEKWDGRYARARRR
ncbi:hypothetical protein F4780DRAFT_778707 [Xylariomycetidae sp. FL0641]|nr:hypothetical protein F4780DRAFT_778707 [Xylariomycetidae sp. FL0641]